MSVYKFSKYGFYALLLSIALIISNRIQFGVVEFVVTIALPVIAIEGITYHFVLTEKEFGQSIKRTITRAYYLMILIICSALLLNIYDKEPLSLVLGYLIICTIPPLCMTIYMGFFAVYMSFEKKKN